MGSPAPDKGHDRLAARSTVDSQLHWRSHLSLATRLQLLTGSLRPLLQAGNRGVATLLVEVCAKPLRRRALPCASVSPSRPSRPPGMSTGKEASVPSDAAATDRLNGSVGAAAKRPRDSEVTT